jgi:N-carbamoylputrescine amidase
MAGFLICTELWATWKAYSYGKGGAQIIVSPRCTERKTVDKWLAGGRACAVVSGSFSLSSNRVSRSYDKVDLGGQGWIIGPDGDVLGFTSESRPFVSVEINLKEAEDAKNTYPRYCLKS